jgi:predicted nucleotidyltransferase
LGGGFWEADRSRRLKDRRNPEAAGIGNFGGKETSVLNDRDGRVAKEFAARVRSRFPDARIWVFGSRARGTPLPDSDLDVCVVVDRLDEEVDRAIIRLAWEVGLDEDVLITTVTYSTGELSAGPCTESALVRAIREDGVAA